MREKACGLDIHKKFIVAAVVDQGGTVAEQRLSRTQADLFLLKDWVSYHGCEVVACESTSDYWVQVYDLVAGQIPMIVGNARDIKAISHKKTDTIDATWIAKLALHDLIPASRVPDQETRDLRSLIRLRKFLVEKRTDLKNQVHHILDSCLFQLAKVFSDIFGASGMVVLTGITEGKPVEEIIASLPKRTQKQGEEIRGVLETSLSETVIVRLQSCLALIKEMDSQIAILMQLVHRCVAGQKRLIRILTSVPGIGYLAAVTLIAEIGDFTDFSSGDKLAGWQASSRPCISRPTISGWERSPSGVPERFGGSVSRSLMQQSEPGRHGFMRSSPGKSGRSDSTRRSLPWHARSSRSSGTWW